jgi:hypothetical protein
MEQLFTTNLPETISLDINLASGEVRFDLNAKEDEYLQLIYDANRGVYIPQCFAEEITVWKHLYPFEYWLLAKGPYPEKSNYKYKEETYTKEEIHDLYWECWETLLNNIRLTDEKGRGWQFIQDGDLWLVADDCPLSIIESFCEYYNNDLHDF